MTTESKSPKFSAEVRERAVRMVFEHRTEHASQWAAIVSIAAKIGCTAQTLSNWVRQAERDQGKRPGTTTDDRERIKALEREVRQTNEILRSVFCHEHVQQGSRTDLRMPADYGLKKCPP